jgi:hypothetical protein
VNAPRYTLDAAEQLANEIIGVQSLVGCVHPDILLSAEQASSWLDCRELENYPETLVQSLATRRRLGLPEIGGILTRPLLLSYHLFSNMREPRVTIGDFYGFVFCNFFNSFA